MTDRTAGCLALLASLLNADFDDIVSLLEAASVLDRPIANAWVNRGDQEARVCALFQRCNESVLWTAVPSLAPFDEGQEVRADV